MANDLSYYEKDGKQYPRVTHILQAIDKPGLARWRGRVGNTEADRKSQEGKDFGNEFHLYAADIGRGKHLKRGWTAPQYIRPQINEYIEWIHTWVDEVIEVETTLYDEEYLCAGTPDLIVRFRHDTEPSIIDVKTSRFVSLDWPLQLSAYRKMKQQQGMPIKRRVVVKVPKESTGKIEVFEYKDHDADELAWCNVHGIWRWMQEDKERTKAAKVIGGL